MTTSPKVLLIEDELPIRKLLRMGLGSQGYQIFEAANGKSGLELLNQSPFDHLGSRIARYSRA